MGFASTWEDIQRRLEEDALMCESLVRSWRSERDLQRTADLRQEFIAAVGAWRDAARRVLSSFSGTSDEVKELGQVLKVTKYLPDVVRVLEEESSIPARADQDQLLALGHAATRAARDVPQLADLLTKARVGSMSLGWQRLVQGATKQARALAVAQKQTRDVLGRLRQENLPLAKELEKCFRRADKGASALDSDRHTDLLELAGLLGRLLDAARQLTDRQLDALIDPATPPRRAQAASDPYAAMRQAGWRVVESRRRSTRPQPPSGG